MTAIVRSSDDALDVDLLKRTIAKGATDGEFDMFVQVCKRLRLDPFSRQIFLVKRYDAATRAEVAQPQVSIDGFRLVAERTGQYRGQTPPQWCGKDGVWHDVWLADEPPTAARCGVYREGFPEPLYRVGRYSSYVQTTRDKQTGQTRPNRMWATMPDVMLHKCIEMVALRAAFPNELSGVYGTDEMAQAENERARDAVFHVRKTLDDVAESKALLATASGKRESDCLDGAPDEARLDEYGLEIPKHPCPVVRSGKPNSGKRWDELPGALVHKMYTEQSDKMTASQIEWCEYLISHRACRKAKEGAGNV